MQYIILILFALTLVGCANDGDLRREIAIGNLKIATQASQAAQPPLADISVPVSGCNAMSELSGALKAAVEANNITWDEMLKAIDQVKSSCTLKVVVQNPIHRPTQMVATPDDPTARVWEKGIDQVGTLLNIAAGGQAAKMLVKSTGQGIVEAIKAQPEPIIVPQQVVVPAQVVNTPPAQVVNPVVVNPPPAQVGNPVIVEPVVVNPIVVTP